MECLHLSFSCQGRGSSTFSLACIGSVCLKQRFPGGHSLRLAFQVFSFFVVLAYVWLLFDTCFLVILADNLAGTLNLPITVAFVCVFLLLLYSVVRNTYNSLAAFLFARRTDCGFAFTPTAGAQLSVGPRCDFDLHLYMSFLLPVVTRRSHGLGLGNRISVAWFLCDSSIWFRRFS